MHPVLYYSVFAEISEQIKCQKSDSSVSCVLLVILDVDGIFHFTEVVAGTPGLYQESRSRDEFIMRRRACIFGLTRMLTTPGIQQDPSDGFDLILRHKSHQRGIVGQKILLCFRIWKCLDQQESLNHITSISKKMTQRNRLS